VIDEFIIGIIKSMKIISKKANEQKLFNIAVLVNFAFNISKWQREIK